MNSNFNFNDTSCLQYSIVTILQSCWKCSCKTLFEHTERGGGHCVLKQGFMRTFPRHQDVTVKLKFEFIFIKFQHIFNVLADQKPIRFTQFHQCTLVLLCSDWALIHISCYFIFVFRILKLFHVYYLVNSSNMMINLF